MRLATKQLQEVAKIMMGVAGFGSKGTYSYLVVQPNSFTDTGRLEQWEMQHRADKVPEQQLLRIDDILVKRLNPSFVHVMDSYRGEMVASPNLLVVRAGAEVDPQYLGYLLEQREIMGQVAHVTGSAAAIKAVSIKKLSEISIPLISLSDQKKVGEIWRLSRRRKQLLADYAAESDRLTSVIALKIINGGGSDR